MGCHCPPHEIALDKCFFILCHEPFFDTIHIYAAAFDQPRFPHSMEVRGCSEEAEMHVISSSVALACNRVSSLSTMQGLMHVAKEVDQELERFGAVSLALRRISQHLFCPYDLSDYTVTMIR